MSTILIVEDHTMIGEYLASVLSAAGFEPVQARSLAEARHQLAQRHFDLWLCDQRLPDGSGELLLDERKGSHAQVPAIAITADLDSSARDRLLRLGYVDALTKPCAADSLTASVRRALSGGNAVAGPGHTATGERSSTPILDDEAAIKICGRADTVAAMRRLLGTELERLQPALQQLWLTDDRDALSAELHKLSAAAAWCGAAELGAAARDLGSCLATGIDVETSWSALESAMTRLARELG